MSQIVKEEKLVYTAQEVAKILHASPNYVYELIRKGKLKAFKLKSIRILKSALEDFIKQNEGNDLSDIDNVRRLSKYEDNERKSPWVMSLYKNEVIIISIKLKWLR